MTRTINKFGTVIEGDDRFSLEAVMTKADLNWTVEKVANVTFDDHKPTGAFSIRRSTDKKVLGKPVGRIFHPLQNKDAIGWFQPFLDAREASIEVAGSFQGGARIWALAKINRSPLVIAKGDEVEKFILLAHGHDGSISIRLGFTPKRFLCSNYLATAFKSEATRLIRIRHTDQAKRNMEDVRELMNLANSEFEATAEQYRRLASRHINTADLMRYVKTVLKVDPKDEVSPRMKNIIERVIGMAESGRGNTLTSVKGTYWTAYNGVTEYLGYEYGRTQDARMDNLWFGQNSNVNKAALQVALDMAA